jgi:histidinol dehydrogenase
MMQELDSQAADFKQRLIALTREVGTLDLAVDSAVATILAAVKAEGDAAVLRYTQRFDGSQAQSLAELIISPAELKNAFEQLPDEQQAALVLAHERIHAFHLHQRAESWQFTDSLGMTLGQRVTPLDRVGVYVPGGKASYPSSVLMNVVPAKVAGVAEIIMVVPTPKGERNALVLAAAHLAGVTQVFCIGGAQAVGALAYGTETVPAVDKIVGPGNAYVAAAKRRVFGLVGIDMVAGPSEIAIIADDSANPDWVAMDLFSQAEHDETAQSILLSPSRDFIAKVAASIARQLPNQPRAEIIRQSLSNRGLLIHCQDLADCARVSNLIAPEHLELALDQPEAVLALLSHAGAIFIGHAASEALGDYCAGPNHVLPTSGSARFSSPLGVYDFQKRTSLIQATASAASTLGKTAEILALGEGLPAHAQSAALRIKA